MSEVKHTDGFFVLETGPTEALAMLNMIFREVSVTEGLSLLGQTGAKGRVLVSKGLTKNKWYTFSLCDGEYRTRWGRLTAAKATFFSDGSRASVVFEVTP